MNTQAKKAKNQAQKTQGYFDTVLYARVRFNEIKIIEPKKGPKYGAANLAVLSIGEDGNINYQTVDVILSGKTVKEMLWSLHDRWPTDRMNRSGSRWIADVNIGSLRGESYAQKDGGIGAVLKGRLINIRNLRIGDELILGEISEDLPAPILVAPGYINLIDPEKGAVKFAMLDGPTDSPEYRNINLSLESEIDAVNDLIANDLCPKGFKHRDKNPKVFASLEISGLRTEGFKGKDGEPAAALHGVLSGVRYLKVNKEVIVGGKGKAA